jgi:hypothetical protein
MNAAALNKFILKTKFNLEDQRLLMQLLRKDMYATSVDVTSAYHHVSVAEWAQPYLCFNYNNVTYYHRAMPFGISTAPRTLTLSMRQCIKAMRQRWKVPPRQGIPEESDKRDCALPVSGRLGDKPGEERSGTETPVSVSRLGVGLPLPFDMPAARQSQVSLTRSESA